MRRFESKTNFWSSDLSLFYWRDSEILTHYKDNSVAFLSRICLHTRFVIVVGCFCIFKSYLRKKILVYAFIVSLRGLFPFLSFLFIKKGGNNDTFWDRAHLKRSALRRLKVFLNEATGMTKQQGQS